MAERMGGVVGLREQRPAVAPHPQARHEMYQGQQRRALEAEEAAKRADAEFKVRSAVACQGVRATGATSTSTYVRVYGFAPKRS